MPMIVSVSRLANDKVEIRVARPQHDSNPVQEYPSEKEAREEAVMRRNHPQFAPILHPAVLLVWDLVAALVANPWAASSILTYVR